MKLYTDRAKRPRLCKYYCNAMRPAGFAGPLCPYCDDAETALDFWDRLLAARRQ